ncbi:MAG: hypothetical protein JNL10_06615 [Verrucomicrobiales bacterium]|nr:hypothetical protein [Verrucomicrobiales bacterium]
MFAPWSNYFTLTGASGATLLGLLFVVVTLGGDLSKSRKLDIARASMTPALYSFTSVLVQSMIVMVPWISGWHGGLLFVVIGIGGGIYRIHAVRVRRTLHLRAIQGPVDWIFHNAAPVAASGLLTAGGVAWIRESAFTPFFVALSSATFLVSGIYRSWGETLALIGLPDKES